jgi:hypothetical protein
MVAATREKFVFKSRFYFNQIITSTNFNLTCLRQTAHKIPFSSSPVVLCIQTKGTMDWRTDGRINNRRSTRMRMRVKAKHCTEHSDTQANNKTYKSLWPNYLTLNIPWTVNDVSHKATKSLRIKIALFCNVTPWSMEKMYVTLRTMI